MFHVKIKLAVHGFQLITNFIHETILSEFRPTVKSIACNFYCIRFIGLYFAERVVSKIFDEFGIYGRYKKVSFRKFTDKRFVITTGVFHDNTRFAINGLDLLNERANPTDCVFDFKWF